MVSMSTWRQRDLTRAMKAAVAADREPQRIVIEPDGRIVVILAGESEETGQKNEPIVL